MIIKMKIVKRKLRLYGVGVNLNFRFYKLDESVWGTIYKFEIRYFI